MVGTPFSFFIFFAISNTFLNIKIWFFSSASCIVFVNAITMFSLPTDNTDSIKSTIESSVSTTFSRSTHPGSFCTSCITIRQQCVISFYKTLLSTQNLRNVLGAQWGTIAALPRKRRSRKVHRVEQKAEEAKQSKTGTASALLFYSQHTNPTKTSILNEVKASPPRINTIEADLKWETTSKSVLASPEFACLSKPACRICCLPSRYSLHRAIQTWETADSRGTWPFLALCDRWNREDNSRRWSKANFGYFAKRFRGFREWGWNNSLTISGNGEENGIPEKEGVS